MGEYNAEAVAKELVTSLNHEFAIMGHHGYNPENMESTRLREAPSSESETSSNANDKKSDEAPAQDAKVGKGRQLELIRLPES